MLQLHNILTGIWCIDDSACAEYIPFVTSYLKGLSVNSRLHIDNPEGKLEADVKDIPFLTQENTGYKVGLGYYDLKPESLTKPGIALINLSGVMTKYASCDNLGMNYYSTLIERCFNAPNIKGIILIVDSPGGEARSMVSFSETLSKRNKPVFGYVSDMACSAAMGIMTQCDLIIANNRFATVGSIGTMATLIDKRKHFEKEGISLIELYATASTEKNKDFRDALDGKTEAVVAKLDSMNEWFLAAVKDGRGERLKNDTWNTGRTFTAPEAVAIGLIDGIDTLENVLDYFVY